MITDLLRIILGLVLALLVPGFIIVQTFFSELKLLEKVAYIITFSVMTDIVIAIFLGYNESWAQVTGGLTFENIMKAEIVVIILLLVLFLAKYLVKKYLYKKESTTKRKDAKKTKKK